MTEGEPDDEPLKQAWNEVAEGFATLGRMMKERYRSTGGDEAAAEPGDAAPQPAAALREAFDRLLAAGRELGDRAAEVARDDDVRAQARRAAGALDDALSTTVNLIGEEVGEVFKRSTSSDAPSDTATEPPSDDFRQ